MRVDTAFLVMAHEIKTKMLNAADSALRRGRAQTSAREDSAAAREGSASARKG